jgi:hypothetical protein
LRDHRPGWCERTPMGLLLYLIKIKIAGRPFDRLILGPLEGFLELLLKQLGFGFLVFSALAKHGLSPCFFLLKQAGGLVNVRGVGFPGRLPVPDDFAERNVNFQTCSAARTFQLNLATLVSDGIHGRMLRRALADVKPGGAVYGMVRLPAQDGIPLRVADASLANQPATENSIRFSVGSTRSRRTRILSPSR